jgi:hypothetical protein
MDLKILLYSFTLGDVEDPELYAAQPIWEWQQTEAGKWCMEHAKDLHWTSGTDFNAYGYKFNIVGTLSPEDCTYYRLRWK